MRASEIMALQADRDLVVTAAAAGMAPVAPPADWFANPGLEGPTPLTVTADGRVYGHLALWGTCHTGLPGCRTPPKGTDYRFFHLKAVDTEEGATVPVGTITVGTGHASLTASRGSAISHYDNTGWAGADVVVGDDEHGIWFSGAVRPDISTEQLRHLRGAALSGDWRPVNGRPELVGVLAVNVPGFPVPRPQALVAAAGEHDDVTLLAAGMLLPATSDEDCGCEEPLDDATAERRVRALVARAEGVEGLLAAAGCEKKQRFRGRKALTAASFDESKHKRVPAGTDDGVRGEREGGQFAPKEGAGGADKKKVGQDSLTVGNKTFKVGGWIKDKSGTGPRGADGMYRVTSIVKDKNVAGGYRINLEGMHSLHPASAVPWNPEPGLEEFRPGGAADVGPEERLARARKSRNWDGSLEREPEKPIARLADRVEGMHPATWDNPSEVKALFGDVGQGTLRKVKDELLRRKRLEAVRRGKLEFTDYQV